MLTAESDKKLFLLDAYALIFRAYYAFIRNPRINSKGQNTSAVFGFTTTVLDVLKNEKPTHLAVVFDPPGPTFRHEEYTEYKANRDETPEDIRASVPRVLEVAEACLALEGDGIVLAFDMESEESEEGQEEEREGPQQRDLRAAPQVSMQGKYAKPTF